MFKLAVSIYSQIGNVLKLFPYIFLFISNRRKDLLLRYIKIECVKFRGSHTIAGIVPPCHRAFAGPKFF